MTQCKIERWDQTLKNRILLENYYLPGDLEAQIKVTAETSHSPPSPKTSENRLLTSAIRPPPGSPRRGDPTRYPLHQVKSPMKQRTAILPVVDEVTGSCVSSVLASPAGEGAAPRRFVGLLLAVAFFGAPASVVAQDAPCAEIIEAFSVVTVEFRDDSKFETHANRFCDEYSQARSSNRSFHGSASFDFLKGALNSREASAGGIASKFCSAADSSRAHNEAFRIYKETVAPEAYDAYRICRQTLEHGVLVDPYVSLDKTRVTFSISDKRKDPERFEGIDSEIFKCRERDKTIDRKGVNGEEVVLSSDALNVVCTRVPVTCVADTPDQRCPRRLPKGMPSYQFYPKGHLTLNLSSGQQNIEFPSREDGTIIRELTELEGQVAELRGILEAHNDHLVDLDSFRDSHAHVPLSKMRWHDVKDARVNAGRMPADGTNRYSTMTFRNDRDYQIVVSVTSDGDSSFCGLDFVVDGTFFAGPIGGNSRDVQCQMSMLVPPRSSYRVFYKRSILSWYEFFASNE